MLLNWQFWSYVNKEFLLNKHSGFVKICFTSGIETLSCPISKFWILKVLNDFVAQAVYNKKEEFFLFGSILEATMIDKRSADVYVVVHWTYDQRPTRQRQWDKYNDNDNPGGDHDQQKVCWC